jgi:hypothetical protein
MEKSDIIELFEIFRKHLKDDLWSKYFYLSLPGNYWYNLKEDKLFDHNVTSLGNSWANLEFFVHYRNKNFFKQDSALNYYMYYGEHNLNYGYISSFVKDVGEYKNFLVLPISKDNLNLLQTYSREYKINKIIK